MSLLLLLNQGDGGGGPGPDPAPDPPSGISVTGVPQVHIVDGRGFAIRHVRPGPGEGGSVTVLGRSYGFEWLPMSTHPASPDLVEGSYTRRLGDAGEFELRFPNVASSKGLWREKFSASGALEWIEIYRDGVLEFVGYIERVEVDRGTVTVSGADAWNLLKRAYERDRIWHHAPADVIDHYTRVPVVRWRENWSTSAGWSDMPNSIGTRSLSVDQGRAILRIESGGIVCGWVHTLPSALPDEWELETTIQEVSNANDWAALVIMVGDATDYHAGIRIGYDQPPSVGTRQWAAVMALDGSQVNYIDMPVPPTVYTPGSYSNVSNEAIPGSASAARGPNTANIRLRREDEWFHVEVNGWRALAVRFPWGLASDRITLISTTSGSWYPAQPPDPNTPVQTWAVWPITITTPEPFLRRGPVRGDLVLPGDMPSGGLRGRYHNCAQHQGRTEVVRRAIQMTPGDEPYGERLDPVVSTSAGLSVPLKPGASDDWFGVRWTGSVWIPGSSGAVSFRLVCDDGARLWVGETTGPPLQENWVSGPSTTSGAAASVATEDGWYPIVLEFAEDAGSATIRLQFMRTSSGWTDPGGTSITANTWTDVPTTSLSPLGCHEARIQGQSHFAIIQDVAQQYGYQMLLEPMSLESGEFPGRLVPRLRVGRDTDVVLEVEDDDRNEPVMGPAVTLDASDQAVRLIGAGAGSADGRGTQTLAEVTDWDGDALFLLESWVDVGDASMPQLLEARLNAELALRATPWEEVRGVPRGFERLADTWPLTGALSAMRWRPGDGLRVAVPDIGVIDTEPRQLTQVTRGFMAEGRTSTQVAWRQRPRSAAVALARIARTQALGQRSYQPQKITLVSPYQVDTSVAASGSSTYLRVALAPADEVIRAYIRLAYLTGSGSLSLSVNGTDRTADLGGPWQTYPVEIDITPYATQVGTTSSIYARFTRAVGGSTGAIEAQMIIEVMR